MIGLVITTAPRARPTLRPSMESMRAAGFEQLVLVVSDGVLEAGLPGPVQLEVNDPPRGGLRNWLHALRRAVAVFPDPWIGVLEDDVLWAAGAAAALRSELNVRRPMPDLGYLSLYLSRKVSRPIERSAGRRLAPGWHESKLGQACWGSQGYVFPRGLAVQLAQSLEFERVVLGHVKNRNRDGIVSGFLARKGLRLLYRVPSLLSHELGQANSSLADKPVQQSLLCDYWTGVA